MHDYFIILALVGFAALGMAWMPSVTRRFKISYPIIYVAAGAILYSLIPALPAAEPLINKNFTLRITELVVIISLMGTGLRIDEKFSFQTWKVPFKLVTITMLISIAAVAFLGVSILHLALPSAVLLGAALAPTDPVLASDVQVGPPLENKVNKVKFSLTAEAGLNDGMAFPFTWLAIILATEGKSIGEWVTWYLLFKVMMGIGVGFLLGKGLSYVLFVLPEKNKHLKTRDGLVALSATIMVYGVTELLQGYGFIAVFVAAITLRNSELHHKYHLKLHSFIDEIERIVLAVVLLLFGGSLAQGALDGLTSQHMGVAILFLFVIRPAAVMLTLIGSDLNLKEKIAISFFGIRGIGSLFYLAFAFTISNAFNEEDIWATISFIILLSVIIHGLSATKAMEKLSSESNS
ncbi:MAG: cation:proton antiporter [Flavitalea sp.]